MKVLLINVTCGVGSHGHICKDIAEDYASMGHEVRIAYGRGTPTPDTRKYAVKIGNKAEVYIHALYARLFDRSGFGSWIGTLRFLKWVDEFEPDVIWLHNIHGYYINIKYLFKWIKRHPQVEVKWTLHDCWSFTGHCGHFIRANCYKWKSQCYNCANKLEYPQSVFLDSSRKNYIEKKALFCGVKKMEIIVPSNWLAKHVRDSYLNEYPITVKHNQVNNEVFKYTESDFRKRYNIDDKIVILGVSAVWSNNKGLDEFIELAQMLDDRYVVVLVGMKKRQIKKYSTSIMGLPRTNDQRMMAEYYSSADYFVNASKEETFSMTTLEALSCGAKVIVYRGTACEEVVEMYGSGKVVDFGVEHIYTAIMKGSSK